MKTMVKRLRASKMSPTSMAFRAALWGAEHTFRNRTTGLNSKLLLVTTFKVESVQLDYPCQLKEKVSREMSVAGELIEHV